MLSLFSFEKSDHHEKRKKISFRLTCVFSSLFISFIFSLRLSLHPSVFFHSSFTSIHSSLVLPSSLLSLYPYIILHNKKKFFYRYLQIKRREGEKINKKIKIRKYFKKFLILKNFAPNYIFFYYFAKSNRI